MCIYSYIRYTLSSRHFSSRRQNSYRINLRKDPCRQRIPWKHLQGYGMWTHHRNGRRNVLLKERESLFNKRGREKKKKKTHINQHKEGKCFMLIKRIITSSSTSRQSIFAVSVVQTTFVFWKQKQTVILNKCDQNIHHFQWTHRCVFKYWKKGLRDKTWTPKLLKLHTDTLAFHVRFY